MRFMESAPQNYEEIVDTANRIFTLRDDGNYERDYFQALQPKLYRSPEDLPPHLLAYDGDKLVGMVAVKKNILHVGDDALTVYGIGTVGVLQEYRKQGLMQAMMERVNRGLKSCGADLGELGGKRKRYARFGYFTGGAGMELKLARDEFLPFSDQPYRFEDGTALSTSEQQLCCALNQNQLVYTERAPESFSAILRTGKHCVWKIMHGQTCIGYAATSPACDGIYELEVAAEYDILDIFSAYFQQFNVSMLSLRNFSPTWIAQHPSVLNLASFVISSANERYRIFNYRHVIEAGLRAKQQQQSLIPGSVTLAIEDYGIVTIRVGGDIRVEMSEQTPDLELTGEEAVQLFMGCPASIGLYGLHLPALAANWFPLPIHTMSGDRI